MKEKSEREKMFAEELYQPFSEGLPEERSACFELCYDYNTNQINTEAMQKIMIAYLQKMW